MSETRTWTAKEIATQERALEMRVSDAARELDRAKAWHQAELRELRKFRKAKAKYEPPQSSTVARPEK